MMNRIKAYRTTILGLIFITVSIYLMVQGISFDYWVNGGLILGGLFLIFSGDKFVKQLEEIVIGFLRNNFNNSDSNKK